MRALFVTALAGLLFPLSSFASFNSFSGFQSEDFANYTLYYQSGSEYGTRAATDGGAIQFFPSDMSVTGGRFNTDTYVTTIAIVPKSDFQIATLDFIEYGDYRFVQGADGNSAEFEVSSRLFISSFDDIYNYDVLGADGLYTADESTPLTDWELSGSYDIANFADGFFLTIQNTLTVATLPTSNYDPSEAEGFWEYLQVASSHYSSKYDSSEYGNSEYDGEKGKKHKGDKRKKKHKKNKRGKKYGKGKHKWGWDYGYDDDFLQLDKKRVALQINGSVSEIPVPAAAWLFASALGALTLARRRK